MYLSRTRHYSKPMLSVDGVSYLFPGGKVILDDISFTVGHGEKVGLIGSVGCGKSTLLYLIKNFLTPSQGKISISGIEVNRSNKDKIRAMAGLVTQNPDDHLFSRSVYDAVAFEMIAAGKPKAEITQKVARALGFVHLTGSERRNPFKMSGGEKKKVALAASIVNDPLLLLLDEPTAGLDAGIRSELIELLDSMDKTMLIASHDLELIGQLTTHTVVLAGGYIIASGPTSEILSNHTLLLDQGLLG